MYLVPYIIWRFLPHSIGERIESEESRLLGKILSKTNFPTKQDIDDIEQYIIENKMTYGEIQIMLSEDSTTLFLSENLKDKLQSSEFYTEISIFFSFIDKN